MVYIGWLQFHWEVTYGWCLVSKMYLSVPFFLIKADMLMKQKNKQAELRWNENLWKWRRKKNKEERDADQKLGICTICLWTTQYTNKPMSIEKENVVRNMCHNCDFYRTRQLFIGLLLYMPFVLKIQQFPTYFTCARVINKSSGLTFDEICFCLLQFVTKESYIALSRVLFLDSGICPSDDHKLCDDKDCVFVCLFIIL